MSYHAGAATPGLRLRQLPAMEVQQMFGKDALCEVVRRHATRPAAEIMRAVTDALAAFRSDCPQQDDVTLVVVKIAF